MAQSAFLAGPARNELTVLAFFREQGVLGVQSEVCCKTDRDGVPCGARVYEGLRGSAAKKTTWRCTKNGCNGVLSVRTKNHFFVYVDSVGLHHSRLELHIILDLALHWLFTTETIRQVSSKVFVLIHTVLDWFNLCRETVK